MSRFSDLSLHCSIGAFGTRAQGFVSPNGVIPVCRFNRKLHFPHIVFLSFQYLDTTQTMSLPSSVAGFTKNESETCSHTKHSLTRDINYSPSLSLRRAPVHIISPAEWLDLSMYSYFQEAGTTWQPCTRCMS